MRVLVFGASSAQGYWDSQGGWADRLKKYYDDLQFEDFTKDTPHVMNLGVSGDSTTDMIKRLDAEATARTNEKGVTIVVQIGSNNAAEENGKLHSTPEDYQKDLQIIIDTSKKHTDKILVVGFQAVDEKLTCPVSWRALFYRNHNIKLFEDAALDVCQKEGVPFVPVHGKFLEKNAQSITLQAHDGLHPNDQGHQLIFELVRPELDRLINT